MNPSEYIIQRLEELKSQPIPLSSDQSDIASLIYKFLMSKKFRKYSTTPEYQKHIESVIQKSVINNEPIKLTIVFGGYKLWRLEEAPEVDWAELFSLIYYTNWLKPILAIYKPGVWFDFFSDDVILERMNNIPHEDTEQYAESFNSLLDFIKPYLPENLRFTLSRVGDQYENDDEFTKELKALIEKNKSLLDTPLTPQQIETIDLNVKLKSEQANDPLWREKVNLIHEAYTQVSKRRPYYRNAEKIFIITRPVKDSLAVGTTKRSVVKFWIGAGTLGEEKEYAQYILSPKQLNEGTFTQEEIYLEGLEGKNFRTIRIVSK